MDISDNKSFMYQSTKILNSTFESQDSKKGLFDNEMRVRGESSWSKIAQFVLTSGKS